LPSRTSPSTKSTMSSGSRTAICLLIPTRYQSGMRPCDAALSAPSRTPTVTSWVWHRANPAVALANALHRQCGSERSPHERFEPRSEEAGGRRGSVRNRARPHTNPHPRRRSRAGGACRRRRQSRG
jgi:hypothetical protein